MGDIFSTQLAYHRSNVAMERYFLKITTKVNLNLTDSMCYSVDSFKQPMISLLISTLKLSQLNLKSLQIPAIKLIPVVDLK